MAAARASWFAFPVTKLSNEKPRLRRERSCTTGSAAGRAAAGALRAGVSAPRASTSRRPNSRPHASAARRSIREAKRSRTSSSTNRLGAARISVSSRAASRISRAQQDARWTRGFAQPARTRSASPRTVIVVAATQKRFLLNAARRLRQKAQFEHLLRQGNRRVLEGYTFFVERRTAGKPRLGILISRKHARAAVERNRMKR